MAQNLNASPGVSTISAPASSPAAVVSESAAQKPSAVSGPAGTAEAKRIQLYAIKTPGGDRPRSEIFAYPQAKDSAWKETHLPVANVSYGVSAGVRYFDLYRSPMMQPKGARAFRWLTLCKGERATLDRATSRALRVVAENLTGYGWTVEIIEAKRG